MRRLIVLLALGPALVAGCGRGPSQVGAAAIVDASRVSLGEVQTRVDTALRDPQAAAQVKQAGQLDDVTRKVLTAAVLHDLLEEAARREGLVVTEDQVSQVINSAGGPEAASSGLIYGPSTIRERVRDQLLAVALGRKYFDHLAVTVDVASADNRDQADALARRLVEHPEAAAQILSDDPAVLAARPSVRLRAGEDPGTATTVVFGLPAGWAAVFQPQPGQGGWFVVHVVSRSTDSPAPAPTPPAPATANVQHADQVDQQTMEGVGLRLLQPLAAELGVRINPRYGVWDPIQLRVVPPEETAGDVFPPSASPAPATAG